MDDKFALDPNAAAERGREAAERRRETAELYRRQRGKAEGLARTCEIEAKRFVRTAKAAVVAERL